MDSKHVFVVKLSGSMMCVDVYRQARGDAGPWRMYIPTAASRSRLREAYRRNAKMFWVDTSGFSVARERAIKALVALRRQEPSLDLLSTSGRP